jgi:hypothetical protein
MARVNQFAKDLGINYNQAKNLINEGRSRKDGGSQILEKTMKPIKAKDGKYNKVTKPKKKPKNFKKTVNKIKMEKAIEKGQATVGDFNEMSEYDMKQFLKGNKKGTFKDLSGDGEITMKDVLIGRGVLEKPQEKAGGGMPKMPKYRDGGVFRGCGAQVKGKKFKGIF